MGKERNRFEALTNMEDTPEIIERGKVEDVGTQNGSEVAIGPTPVIQKSAGRYSLHKESPTMKDSGSMNLALAVDVKKGFSVSEANQAEIRESCEVLEKKLNLLSVRTQAVEYTVDVKNSRAGESLADIQLLKRREQEMQDKLEQLENSLRRNNLRMLNVPEGEEGDNLKTYVMSHLKRRKTITLEAEEEDIARAFKESIRTRLGKILTEQGRGKV
ncbi:hypothetical protein NDU88_009181 [Pleurodeles waltl]|uniref:Uncharacterized protein n=1 Tax=Pleurodeles waltl TaxID=8319 RepID=A0AAV7PV72_PLEWA|nr:hypothetical protein NDU88_009181 [Pleurodeles waltl]